MRSVRRTDLAGWLLLAIGFAFPSTGVHGQVEWTECETLACPPGAAGVWDSFQNGAPCAVSFDGNEFLFYTGRAQQGEAWSLGFARIPRDADNCVLEHSPDAILDNIDGPTLLPDDPNSAGTAFTLWGGSGGGSNCAIIRGFVSENDNAGFVATRDPAAAGAVLTGEVPWEGGCVLNPTVVHDGEIYRMWYDGGTGDSRTWRVGYAWSDDGIHWERHGVPVLQPDPAAGGVGVYAPHVLQDAETGVFEMWYTEIVDHRNTWIGYATSTDGVSWSKHGRIDLTAAGRWPTPGHPTVLRDGDDYRMWYGFGAQHGAGIAHASGRRAPATFRRGDCNDDGAVDISDAVSTLFSLFLGGETPGCDDACDSNDDGAVDPSDPITTLEVLFLGKGAIPAPGMNECGVDPANDDLDCDRPCS